MNRIRLSPDLATGEPLCWPGPEQHGSCELSVFITTASADDIVPVEHVNMQHDRVHDWTHH